MEASARMDELRAKLAKPKPATPDKWEPDDHPHAIWCSYYGPDDAMQSGCPIRVPAAGAQPSRAPVSRAVTFAAWHKARLPRSRAVPSPPLPRTPKATFFHGRPDAPEMAWSGRAVRRRCLALRKS